MIGVGETVKKELQIDMVNNLITTDTQIIDKKHSVNSSLTLHMM